MASLNKVFLMGNLTRDPELRYTSSGQPVCSFSMAINRYYNDKSGERQEDTCFMRVTVWGKAGENCAEYLKKGRPALVEGRLQSRSWEADGGQKRTSVEVVADNVQFLGGREDGERNQGRNQNRNQDQGRDNGPPLGQDDIPF